MLPLIDDVMFKSGPGRYILYDFMQYCLVGHIQDFNVIGTSHLLTLIEAPDMECGVLWQTGRPGKFIP